VASPGTWANGPTVFAYQWRRCDRSDANCVPVGADADHYNLTVDDLGSRLRLRVTATNAAGSATAKSSGTRIVGAPVLLVPPRISGGTDVGETLVASTGTWTNAPARFDYQWLRCDRGGANCASVGADANQYDLAVDDVGSRLRVRVTATNAAGSAVARSGGTGVVGRPVVIAAPGISGGTDVGQTLVASTGTWTNAPATFDYQWLRCVSPVADCVPVGVDRDEYVLTVDDVGARMRVRVTATNAAASAAAKSIGTRIVRPAPPPSPTGLTVTPDSATVQSGSATQLAASEQLSDGTSTDVTASASWSSSDASVITVDASGDVTGVGAGSAVVTASVAGFTAEATITVTTPPPTPTGIAVTPADPVTWNLNDRHRTQQFEALESYSDGSSGDVTNDCQWTSSKPNDVPVGTAGDGAGFSLTPGLAINEATTSGTATISCTKDGFSASGTIKVIRTA
jgi:hypothetical protein